jgi:hypothetical protein
MAPEPPDPPLTAILEALRVCLSRADELQGRTHDRETIRGAVRWSFGALGRVPRLAQRRVILFFWPTRASSANQISMAVTASTASQRPVWRQTRILSGARRSPTIPMSTSSFAFFGDLSAARCGFFLPVRVLSRLFRRLFLEGIATLHAAGGLQAIGRRRATSAPSMLPSPLCATQKKWSTPFAGSKAVLAYLSRYTHRVAIANSRLIRLDDKGVTFQWKDYRARGKAPAKPGSSR